MNTAKLPVLATTLIALLTGCTGLASPSSSPLPTQPSPAVTTLGPTPPVSSTSVSPAPSTSSTLSPDQEAAVRAVNGIRDLAIRIEADPTKFTKAEVTAEYGRFAAGTLLKVNVESFVSTKAKNHRTTGLKQYQITAVSKMVDTKSARGLQIVVIACQDQREVVERDAQGKIVDTNLPPFFEMTYTVLKTPGVSGWLAYGVQGRVTSCGN